MNDSLSIMAVAEVEKDGKKYYGLGKDGELVIRNKADLKWFKFATVGRVCVVGSKTYDKLPNLPERTVLIFSRRESFPHVSKEEVLEQLRNGRDKIAIIGGKETYEVFARETEHLAITTFKEHGKTLEDFDVFYTEEELLSLIDGRKESTFIKFDSDIDVTVRIYSRH